MLVSADTRPNKFFVGEAVAEKITSLSKDWTTNVDFVIDVFKAFHAASWWNESKWWLKPALTQD